METLIANGVDQLQAFLTVFDAAHLQFALPNSNNYVAQATERCKRDRESATFAKFVDRDAQCYSILNKCNEMLNGDYYYGTGKRPMFAVCAGPGSGKTALFQQLNTNYEAMYQIYAKFGK